MVLTETCSLCKSLRFLNIPSSFLPSHFCPLRGLTRQWSYSTSSMDLLGIEHLLPKEEKEISGWLWMRGKLTGTFDDGVVDLPLALKNFGDGQMQCETTVSTHELTVSTD